MSSRSRGSTIRMIRTGARGRDITGRTPEHDPEKWTPGFERNHALLRRLVATEAGVLAARVRGIRAAPRG